MSNNILDISDPIEKLLAENGFELYDLVLEKENQSLYLRIFIENIDKKAVDLEDCIAATSFINKFLDENDPVATEYMLEVASPGIIRKLRLTKHFEQQIGENITVHLKKSIQGFDSKTITGKLNSVDEENIELEGVVISRSNIKNAETTFEF